MPIGSGARGARGFVYLGLLIGVAIIGIGLSATASVWSQTRQREKEAELLFVGEQIRQAISHYYLQSPAAARRFPMTLNELVEDTRAPDKPQRHLRKIYADPITGSAQWGELRLANGQLVGVHSLSQQQPVKVAGFSQRDRALADKTQYAEWIFRSDVPAANPGQAPAGAPGTPAPVAGVR